MFPRPKTRCCSHWKSKEHIGEKRTLLWPGLQGGHLGKSPTTLLILMDTLSTGMFEQGEEVIDTFISDMALKWADALLLGVKKVSNLSGLPMTSPLNPVASSEDAMPRGKDGVSAD